MRQQFPSSRQSKFDNFLYAVVREVDGVPLTVLSALARNDLDPWDAAEELTRLSRNTAAVRLGEMLSCQPNHAGESPSNDLDTIQLLARLPEASTVRRQEMSPAWQSLLSSVAKLKALLHVERPPGRGKQ
jgi:hypothetical protein